MLDSQKLSAQQREDAHAMQDFWREHATHNIGYREAYHQLVRPKDAIGDADWTDLPEHWDLQGDRNP